MRDDDPNWVEPLEVSPQTHRVIYHRMPGQSLFKQKHQVTWRVAIVSRIVEIDSKAVVACSRENLQWEACEHFLILWHQTFKLHLQELRQII